MIADGPWVKVYPGIPGYLDANWVAQAVAALQCPETKAVLSSVRAPMTLHRFFSNFLNSFEFTGYRIDRVPLYELARCGLPVPEASPAAAARVSTAADKFRQISNRSQSRPVPAD